jgi:hypothetical protein
MLHLSRRSRQDLRLVHHLWKICQELRIRRHRRYDVRRQRLQRLQRQGLSASAQGGSRQPGGIFTSAAAEAGPGLGGGRSC